MMKKIVCLFIIYLLGSCSNNSKKTFKKNERNIKDSISELQIQDQEISQLKSGDSLLSKSSNLVDIQTLDSTIRIDLKYATSDNFVGKVLYENVSKVFLQKDVAEKLVQANEYLKMLNPNYRLLVYDGVRPVSIQQIMWDALDSIPINERVKFVSNPSNGSIHNYGAAVDLTICDLKGVSLDMGADYDDIRQIAYPRLESYFLTKGELTEQHIENRKLLRKVMSKAGFYNIETEWWHFNSCTREEAKKKYEIVK